MGQMEDDLIYLDKWKTTSIYLVNGRVPQFICKLNMTSVLIKIEVKPQFQLDPV
jgi:hypothetical protein